MNVKFDHVSLRAKNPAMMKDFLVHLLDLKVGFRPDFPFEGYWLYSKEKDIIHIFNEDAVFYKKDLVKENIQEESTGKNIVNHIAFYSDDYEVLMNKIKSNNLDYSINYVPDSKIEQIFIKAPENLIIEIQAIPNNKG
jgi:catechol 2,3-dioxygenase-like lactoylglutathione lyase family enzyme